MAACTHKRMGRDQAKAATANAVYRIGNTGSM